MAVRIATGLVVCFVSQRLLTSLLFPHQALEQLSWIGPQELLQNLATAAAVDAVDQFEQPTVLRLSASALSGLGCAWLSVCWTAARAGRSPDIDALVVFGGIGTAAGALCWCFRGQLLKILSW